MQEMSHIRATPSLKLRPNHIDRLLDRISPTQLAHRAANPHRGGNGLGLHTSVTTETYRERDVQLFVSVSEVKVVLEERERERVCVRACVCTFVPVRDVKAVLGGSRLNAAHGTGSFIFCSRITSVLSPNILELNTNNFHSARTH